MLLSERLGLLLVGLGLVHELSQHFAFIDWIDSSHPSIHPRKDDDDAMGEEHTTTAGAAVWSTGATSVAGADMMNVVGLFGGEWRGG